MYAYYCLYALVSCVLNATIAEDTEIERENKLRKGIRLFSFAKSSKIKESISLFDEVGQGKDRLAGDALAQLAHIYIFHPTYFNIAKAFQYANQSSSLGSPRGMHLLAFVLRHGLFGIEPDETKAYDLDNAAARNHNYIQSQMTIGFVHYIEMKRSTSSNSTDLHCQISLRNYEAAATNTIQSIRRNHRNDFLSLRVADAQDRLCDRIQARLARDKETLDYYQYEAEHNNGKALYALGKIYQVGANGVRRDMKTAISYFEKAVTAENIPASAELGRLLTLGNGIDVDLGRGLTLLRTAVATGDPSAMATLGILIRQGLFTSSDPLMSYKYLKEAALHGDSEAEYELGQSDLLEGRIEAAVEHFHRAAKEKHIKSLQALGNMYDKGIGVNKSCERAVEYYKNVAESGYWIEDGIREGRRNYAEGKNTIAFLHSLLGADEGYEIGQFNAAWLLLKHHIHPDPDQELAFMLLEHSNLLGVDKSSLLLIGDMYRKGHHRNMSLAAHYYKLATEEGSALAMSKLAPLYQNGAGVNQDEEKASLLLRRAFRGLILEMQGLRLVIAEIEIALRLIQISISRVVREIVVGSWLKLQQ